jgi:Flp pilus assembly protein TadD
MGLLDWLPGKRRALRDEARAAASTESASILARGDARAALACAESALLDAPDDARLLRAAAAALQMLGRVKTAELARRAADAPHDVPRTLELGAQLLGEDALPLADAVLGHALSLAPFDAVVRSERALAQALSGRHDAAVATLSLHPCLADDPGALFQFAWSSLLAGDPAAAAGAAEELTRHPSADKLWRRLVSALRRADIPPDAQPPDARDYYFLEHGALLLEPAPVPSARFDALELDAAHAARIVSRAAAALRLLEVRPPACVAVDEAALPYAEALGAALSVPAQVLAAAGRVPDGVLVARVASDLAAALDRLGVHEGRVLTFAMAQVHAERAPCAPDLLGVFAARLRFAVDPALLARIVADAAREAPPFHARLTAFVEARRALLPPGDAQRVVSAYLADAPLR